MGNGVWDLGLGKGCLHLEMQIGGGWILVVITPTGISGGMLNWILCHTENLPCVPFRCTMFSHGIALRLKTNP